MNVEFCEDNSGRSKKMRYFRQKNEVKVGAQAPPLDPPLDNENKTNNGRKSQINTNKIPNNR